MENKRQFKCTWVNPRLKDEKELVLYPDKDGNVADVLNEAREQIDSPLNMSGKLRLLEIISAKVFNVITADVPVEHLMTQAQRSFRIEVGGASVYLPTGMRSFLRNSFCEFYAS